MSFCSLALLPFRGVFGGFGFEEEEEEEEEEEDMASYVDVCIAATVAGEHQQLGAVRLHECL